MAPRDFALLVLMCLCWAINVVLSRQVIAEWGVPPLFYAALRFSSVIGLVFFWLRPMPRPAWRLIAVALCMGAANFALLNIGLQTATASSAAVVSQLGVPITTLLSVLMLGERIRWRRGLGIALAFGGAMLVIVDPAGFEISSGLIYVLACAFVASLGAVLIKQMDGVKPLTFQAWVALISAPPLLAATFVFESGQVEAVQAAGWPFLAAMVFSVLVVSLFAPHDVLSPDRQVRGEPALPAHAHGAADVDRHRRRVPGRDLRPTHGDRYAGGAFGRVADRAEGQQGCA
jgi:drug/metabolite transporter (DMT)-like permease